MAKKIPKSLIYVGGGALLLYFLMSKKGTTLPKPTIQPPASGTAQLTNAGIAALTGVASGLITRFLSPSATSTDVPVALPSGDNFLTSGD